LTRPTSCSQSIPCGGGADAVAAAAARPLEPGLGAHRAGDRQRRPGPALRRALEAVRAAGRDLPATGLLALGVREHRGRPVGAGKGPAVRRHALETGLPLPAGLRIVPARALRVALRQAGRADLDPARAACLDRRGPRRGREPASDSPDRPGPGGRHRRRQLPNRRAVDVAVRGGQVGVGGRQPARDRGRIAALGGRVGDLDLSLRPALRAPGLAAPHAQRAGAGPPARGRG